MTITVSTADPRSLKALTLLEGSAQWQRGHTRDGRSFYAVPSQSSDVLHMADCRACTCRDFLRRLAPCKHILAVRLHVARLKAQQPRSSATPQQPRRPRLDPTRVAALSAEYAALFSEEG